MSETTPTDGIDPAEYTDISMAEKLPAEPKRHDFFGYKFVSNADYKALRAYAESLQNELARARDIALNAWPAEPTDDMINAGAQAIVEYFDYKRESWLAWKSDAEVAYKAMRAYHLRALHPTDRSET